MPRHSQLLRPDGNKHQHRDSVINSPLEPQIRQNRLVQKQINKQTTQSGRGGARRHRRPRLPRGRLRLRRELGRQHQQHGPGLPRQPRHRHPPEMRRHGHRLGLGGGCQPQQCLHRPVHVCLSAKVLWKEFIECCEWSQ
ncbi:hypothetical protein VTK26DRAFT_2700 [Humicola hyalothermophila]